MWRFVLLAVPVVALHAQLESTFVNSDAKITCNPPFLEIGNHCLLIDNLIYGTWPDMKVICQDLGGELVGFEDANLLADVINFIKANGLDSVNYWTGGKDRQEEGVWKWQNENSLVHMNTPLWGDYSATGQEPQGGELENCAALNKDDYFFMHDFNCNDTFSLLCEQKDDATPGIAYGKKTMKKSSIECPEPYKDIIGRCLYFNVPETGTWEEHKRFCELLSGKPAKVDDANLLGAIYDYIVGNGLANCSFFIDGSDENVEGDWRFLDGSPVPMGTPFWGNMKMSQQEPLGGVEQNCVIIYKDDYFFFHDTECTNYYNVICEA